MTDDSEASVAVSGAETKGAPEHPILDTIVKVSVAVAGAVVALTAAFYLLVYIPVRDHRIAVERERQAQMAAQAQRDTIARQAKEKAEKAATVKAGLDSCLAGADTDYTANWSHSCLAHGLGPGCALPSYETDAIVKTRENTKARCVEVAKYGLPPSQ